MFDVRNRFVSRLIFCLRGDRSGFHQAPDLCSKYWDERQKRTTSLTWWEVGIPNVSSCRAGSAWIWCRTWCSKPNPRSCSLFSTDWKNHNHQHLSRRPQNHQFNFYSSAAAFIPADATSAFDSIFREIFKIIIVDVLANEDIHSSFYSSLSDFCISKKACTHASTRRNEQKQLQSSVFLCRQLGDAPGEQQEHQPGANRLDAGSKPTLQLMTKNQRNSPFYTQHTQKSDGILATLPDVLV